MIFANLQFRDSLGKLLLNLPSFLLIQGEFEMVLIDTKGILSTETGEIV